MGIRRKGLIWLGAVALATSLCAIELAAELFGTRTISLRNIHTDDVVTVEYKRNGRYVPDAMERINWVMRDWRRDEQTTMDPKLVDLLWDMHRELGSKEPIHLISAFRSHTTNNMLRTPRGGQASESRHILGKAADVHFPDVPLKRLRYSSLVRERGGVGYYPTSAIPFVHLDTDRVRHWPRLPRYELALLFPNGKSQHQPADGGSITKEDVQVAQARHRELAVQVAEFHDHRNRPAGTGVQVASMMPKWPAAPTATASPMVAAKQAPMPPPASQVVAALAPEPKPASPAPARLAAEPRVVDRPSQLSTRPTNDERAKLAQLAALASFEPQLIVGPRQAVRPAAIGQMPSLTGIEPKAGSVPPQAAPRLAALAPETGSSLTDSGRIGAGNWVKAPEFDDEHPDELSYRPFPVTPYMTATASADDPALAHMIHPDVSKTLEMLDQAGSMPPMKLRPTQQIARLMWAQEFKGGAVDVDQLFESSNDLLKPNGVNNRAVKTGMK